MLTGLQAGCAHNHSKIVSPTSMATSEHTQLAKVVFISSWIRAVQGDASASLKDDPCTCTLINQLDTRRPISPTSHSKSTTLGTLGNNYQ